MAGQAPLLGGSAGRRARKLGQAGEIIGAKREHVGLLVGEHVLAKAGSEARQPVAYLLQPLLRGSIQPGAGPTEQRVIARQYPGLLGCQAKVGDAPM